VELIVVIAIIGILAAVLVPSLTGYINKARQSAAEQDVYQSIKSLSQRLTQQLKPIYLKVNTLLKAEIILWLSLTEQ
jgi:type II secretory pathway pseudopilin PulG